MPLTIGLPVAAFAGFAAAAAGMVLLRRAAGHRNPPPRGPYLALVLGACLSALGLAVTALLVLGSPVGGPGRLAPVTVGLTIGIVAQLGGLLRLPGAADRRGDALRHILDGALIAVCLLHITWTLFLQPAFAHRHGRVSAVPMLLAPGSLLIEVPVVVTLTTCGITAVLASRVRAPKAALLTTAAGVAGTALTGVGLLLALRSHDGGTPVLALGAGHALAIVLTALAVRRTNRIVTPEVGLPGTGTMLALVPASASIIAAVIRIAAIGSTDNPSIVIAAMVGGLITARQMLANRAAHRYANRLAERESTFREMAFTDPLTGLGNRRQLNRVLYEQAVGGPPCVLLAIDLDGFKNVNDIRGHDVGDAVLVEVARRLRASLRPGDTAARLGGDEFAVLMWGGPEEAQRVAERLLIVLGGPYDMGGSALFLSASIGLAGCATAENVPGLLHNADLSLRFAKQRGKCRVELYDAAYDQWMRRRTTVEQELRGAIGRDELGLVYQPVIDLDTGRPVGVEALVRWYHPTLGQVPPGEFIPIAEEAGFVDRIDRWVLHQACRQLSRWMAEGYSPWISVNISIRELHVPEYVDQVVEVLAAHRVPPDRLVLEVTEHAVAVDLNEVIDRLGALRQVGVRIALDDFGAGYSSLSQLRKLPVDILKIDQTLVIDPASERSGPSTPPLGDGLPRTGREVAARDRGRPAGPLVGVVMELGRKLGLEVIAEGVAEPAQREVVVAAGCRLVQGELLGRAMPAEHFEAMLAAPLTIPAPRPSQDMGQVDSGHEMRQS